VDRDRERRRAGSDYGFVLDGEGPFPDPRSAYQPKGVHGLSRVVNHDAFPWNDWGFQQVPLASAVIYELHVGTFTPTGTFDSAIERLPHLLELGITHVELMPVNTFPGKHGWGYDGVDLFAPHPFYGGPDALKRLVEACHACGLAVLLDVVYNHLGPSGNYLARFGPYFDGRYSTPWGPALNFDGAESDEVRRFFCDNALMWLRDYRFDGLRLDAVHAILDVSAEPFLEQLAREVRELERTTGNRYVLIAESDANDPRLVTPADRGGFGYDAQWSDDFHHALHAVLTGERSGYYRDFGMIADLAKALRQAFVYDGRYSAYRRRRHGRPPRGLDGDRFLGYLQNHDQVGNRARGDRIAQLVSPGRQRIGAALVLTAPFVPMLFQGEEWGASTPFFYFTDHAEPGLAKAVREGRRKEFAAFGWKADDVPDPQEPKTFKASVLDWTELAKSPHVELLKWHTQLLQFRRREPALTRPHLDAVNVRHDETAGWISIERGKITVVCNFSEREATVPVRAGEHRVILEFPGGSRLSTSEVNVPPESILLMKTGDA
jgi:maltooligosyltrehalose trehalohydrolase